MEGKLPINKKLLLSASECSEYTGIGIKKMRSELKNPACQYSVWVGERCFAVRELMEKYFKKEAM